LSLVQESILMQEMPFHMIMNSLMSHDEHIPSKGMYDHDITSIIPQIILALPFVMVLVLYIVAVAATNRKYKRWPSIRTACWVTGCLLAIGSVIGPLAEQGFVDFRAHMVGHLLLGMLAPMLIALAAPLTLLLRSLSVPLARRLAALLRSRLAQWLTHPIITALLNIGGLWYLYTTNLYILMHEHTVLHIFIHAHVFIAGYLFTVSIIYIDPMSHRTSYFTRAIILIVALAAHGILSKIIYAFPPTGVPADQAERGGMLMYYGGDLIDILLIFILCLQWYRAARPRLNKKAKEFSHP